MFLISVRVWHNRIHSVSSSLGTEFTSYLRCSPCIPIQFILIKPVLFHRQLLLNSFEGLRIKEQGWSLADGVLAHLLQCFIGKDILFNIEDGDTPIDCMSDILNSCPEHRIVKHALWLWWQVYGFIIWVRLRRWIVCLLTFEEVREDWLLQVHCQWIAICFDFNVNTRSSIDL